MIEHPAATAIAVDGVEDREIRYHPIHLFYLRLKTKKCFQPGWKVRSDAVNNRALSWFHHGTVTKEVSGIYCARRR